MGAWGHGIFQNDQVLDRIDILKDKCEDYLHELYSKVIDTHNAFYTLGTYYFYIKSCLGSEMPFNQDILDEAKTLLEICINDKEFINGWKNPFEIRKTLSKVKAVLNYEKLVTYGD